MMKIIFTLSLFLLSLLTFSQVSENRKSANFSKIKVSQGIELYFTQSENVLVKVETDDLEKMSLIKTELEGNELHVFIDSGSKNTNSRKKKKRVDYSNSNNFKTLKVYISAPMVTDFEASSAAVIAFVNRIEVPQLSINASSSGKISGAIKCSTATIALSSSARFKSNITANKIDLKTSSSATAILNGTTTAINIQSSSASYCDAKDLLAQNADADASSSASISINTNGILNAEASSSASIYYYGNPSPVHRQESSSGKIVQK